MRVMRIYDNSGKTFDRYTVYFDDLKVKTNRIRMYYCLAMSENPFHPQGFCQHSSGQLGNHNGKIIVFKQLLLDCQAVVKRELESVTERILHG